ncbi:MAG: tetratricopeptide repeat protein [Planctomycetes bacterium]|nr:tetratricopeptide repeat protein [Planctomycetota bacterium]
MPSSNPHPRWAWSVPALLAVVLYAATWSAPFLYDDQVCVVENAQIRSAGNFFELWTSSFPPGRVMSGLYRPATAATFLFDHLRGGLSAGTFHATNVLLHAIAAALVARLLLVLGRSAREALLAGSFFALHAVHVEAVAWVVGRAEILAAIFVLWSAIAWFEFVRTRRTSTLVIAALAYFLGLASKENAAMLPFVLLGATWVLGVGPPAVPSEPETPRKEKRALAVAPTRPGLVALAPFLGALVVYAFLRVGALGSLTPVKGSLAFDGLEPGARLGSAFWCLLQDARLLVVPWPLRIDYARELVAGLGEPKALLGLAFSAALFAAALWAWRQSRWAALWLLWFSAFVLIVSNLVLLIGAVMAERFLYVPSVAACALFAALVERGLASARAPFRVGALVLGAALVVGNAAAALARIPDWCDEERFWRVFLAQDPKSEKAHQALGDLAWKRSQAGEAAHTEPALQFLRDGAALAADDPGHTTRDHVEIVLRLADRLRTLGRAEESLAWFEESLRALERDAHLSAFPIADVRVLHALALEAAGRTEDARAAYAAAAAKSPTPGVFVNLGLLEDRLGRPEDALAHLRRATELDPKFVLARVNLGTLLLDRGRADEALKELAIARQLDAGVWIPQLLARWCLERANKPHAPPAAAQALVLVERVSAFVGDGSVYALARGMLAEKAGDLVRATREYDAALAADPNLVPAREGRARIQAALGR